MIGCQRAGVNWPRLVLFLERFASIDNPPRPIETLSHRRIDCYHIQDARLCVREGRVAYEPVRQTDAANRGDSRRCRK